jgi:adenine deaminase
MDKIQPERVFVNGRLVAEEGKLLVDTPIIAYPDGLRRTVKLYHKLDDNDFTIAADGDITRVRVIELIPGQIVNLAGEATLTVENGVARPSIEQDVLPICCVERYGKNGNIGRGFIHGFGLKQGAIGGSVAHDHHNIVVVGVDPHDMRLAVEALVESQGGFVVVAGGVVLSLLPLPLCGLMSEEETETVAEKLASVRRAAESLGCTLETPFMALSFVSLPTVPELGITDHGLVDVKQHKITSLFLD